MKHRVLACALIFALVLSTAACGGKNEPDGLIGMPGSSSDFEGETYQNVVEDLESAGFTDVETKPLGDLITGWLSKPDEVDEVTVDGDGDFKIDDRFEATTRIVVSYHSFPPEDDEVEEELSRTPTPADVAPVTQTVENNAELASLLALMDYCSPAIADFATKFKGQSIQFDATIKAMNKHGSYDTRYDILIGAGDYSPTAGTGPAFQFEDENIVSDLGLTGPNIPDPLGVGQNLRVTAIVEDYDANGGCLFHLDPVSTEIR
jgi:hypothetical protein